MASEPVRPRRLAVVLARYRAAAAPVGLGGPTLDGPKSDRPELDGSGLDRDALARAALADTYEVLADLVGVTSAVAGPFEVAELLWPGSLALPDLSLLGLAALVAADWDELVVVPADVPDLPGLVLAKMFQVLHRTDVVVAPERSGTGCVAIGLRLPVPDWLRGQPLDLDSDPYQRLLAAAPAPGRCSRAPDWHRLRTAEALRRLDPGLEGWEETRALLAGTVGRTGA